MKGLLDSDEALEVLREGGVIGLPTDTVYGLAASLARRDAIDKLFTLKRRPTSLALPILADSVASIEGLHVWWSERARALSDALWPGALTIVVPVPPELAALVGSASDTAGFRVPNDKNLRELLSQSGPLAVSSANDHGESPCRTAVEVMDAFGEHDEFGGVLDGGERGGDVSTVVALEDDTWRVLRLGAVSTRELARFLD
ncbi:MAG: L-threonylcarbamoyladenylate synthase [Acidimicrobiales bacterium]